MHVLLILSPVTNLIITFSFVVGFYSPTLFLVFQVSIKSWKGNFSFNHKKWFSKRKNTNEYFSQFLLLILLFYVCRPIIHTIKKFFPEFHWLFQKLKEIITNVVFFENFVFKVFAHSKKVSINISYYSKLIFINYSINYWLQEVL